MLRHDGLTDFIKTAPKRLADARELLESPTRDPARPDAQGRHLTAAYYLAGYAVECAMKAYAIQRVGLRRGRARLPAPRWTHVIEEHPQLAGRHSHSLALLAEHCRLASMLGTERPDEWKLCRAWDYNARYDPTPRDRAEVARFVAACAAVYAWVMARL